MAAFKSKISVFKEISNEQGIFFVWFRVADDEEIQALGEYIVPSAILTEQEHNKILNSGAIQ